MEFSVLGALEVRATNGEVPLRRGLPRTLILALVLRPRQTVSSTYLVEALWGDALPQNPTNALQIQVSYVRKALGNAESDGATLVETRAGGYSLVVDDRQIDANRFEAAVRAFEPVHQLRGVKALAMELGDTDEALALWRGDPLEDAAGMDFAMGESARLDELRWTAIEHRIDLLLALGRHSEAVGDLAEMLRRMPFRERLHEQLVLALYRSGRQAEALRAYDDARRTLVEELGIDPGPDLRRLEDAVLRQDPALDWAQPEPDVTVDAGPARPAVVPAKGRVPVPFSPLIGRDEELGRLDGLVDRHRALTLTGPAGAGKTRLAIDLAHRQGRPVVYVDLSPIDDPALTAPTVAAAAGASVAPGDDPVAAIAETLAAQDLLLVLDTCEHLVKAVAQLASNVLRSAPAVHVLATSRRPLGLAGEFAWPVPPLALPPPEATTYAEVARHGAVALFVERASAVCPDFAVSDEVAGDIAAICSALDGLPLAIELAAARADVLSPAAIRSRLEDRFALLVDGGVDAAPRQQTLRAAIDWSFELLSDEQRCFFARLGSFAGTFDLDAALVIAGADLDTPLDVLSSLVRQSMVTRAGSDRYRLLDTLRAYALDLLADLDADGTRERHAEFYTALAERGESEIRGPDQVRWLESFRQDINNFRAALEWSLLTGDVTRAARQAGALAWFWTLNGMLTEAMQHLERLVSIEDLPPATRANCLWGYGLLAASLGRLETARDAGCLAVDLARSCGDTAATAYGLNAVAVASWALGDHEGSLAAHGEAVVLVEKTHDQWGLALCKVLQARTLFDLGDPDAATVAAEGVEHARRAGDLHVLGIALTQIAQLAMSDGDPADAVTAAEEALALQERIGYTEGTVSALHVLGQAHRLVGEVEQSRALHRRALRLASRIGHAVAMCEAMEDLARTDAADEPEVALMLIRAARAERSARGLPLRQRDAEELTVLEEVLVSGAGAAAPDRPFATLVAELAG